MARPPARPYHHGRLREAMVEATVALIEEVGPERVTVREAARRAGVSPGAPFRHFANKTALMTAVAEEAMARFKIEVLATMAPVPADDPIAGMKAIGGALVRWAVANPTHFKVLSDRTMIDFEGSAFLPAANREMQAIHAALLTQALDRGLIRPGDPKTLALAGRALVYGLARMYVDGQLGQWDVAPAEAETRITAAIDDYVEGLRA
jgi:AcrR family transcriptional regulator